MFCSFSIKFQFVDVYEYISVENVILFDSSKSEKEIQKNYPGIKKTELSDTYSSNTVEKITKDELKKIILQSGFL